MAATASSLAYPRKTTGGWAPIPVSLIENLGLLPHGELALALVVLRRGGDGVPISDRNWSAWTGLSPRLKEMAMKGLRDKGLTVNGRGDHARFSWDQQRWTGYVRTAPESTKPRTAGRQVDPKPGAKVHPECREHGCAMVRAECAAGGLTLVTATPNAKPVSQTTTEPAAAVTIPQNNQHTGIKPVAPTPNAKRVSQTDTPELWAQTLSTLQKLFPLVTFLFLVQLLAKVRAGLGSGAAVLTDSELAQAVELAWREKAEVQKREGLFLETVPRAVLLIRQRAAAAAASPPVNQLERQARARDKIASDLAARGVGDGPQARVFQETAAKIRAVDLASSDPLETLGTIEDEFIAGVVASGFPMVSIEAEVERYLKPYRDRILSSDQRAGLRAAELRRLVFHALRLPRFADVL